jgi:CMP-N,N'-diacetyllegionaminic acid synthase
MDKKPIAIIPARIGSKRIKYKNIILFKKKPLIFWTIDAAIQSKIFSEIYVSTDSKIIRDKLSHFKNKIKYIKRPKKLSGDKTKTKTLIKYLIRKNSFHKKFKDFFLLQPTSPLRTKKNIIEMWKIYLKNKLTNLTSVNLKKNNYRVKKSKINLFPKSKNVFKKSIYLNGSIYINNIQKFLKNPDFIKDRYNYYLLKNKHSLDLDNIKDLKNYKS